MVLFILGIYNRIIIKILGYFWGVTATATIAQASVKAATIAQASAMTCQGGLSNLQRFKAHHPPTFKGGEDPMIADNWFWQVEKILEAMEIISNATKIKLVMFQLEGESQIWWDWVKDSRDLEEMTWEDFQELFMSKFFPASARHAKI